jgi:hypothetical protein
MSSIQKRWHENTLIDNDEAKKIVLMLNLFKEQQCK